MFVSLKSKLHSTWKIRAFGVIAILAILILILLSCEFLLRSFRPDLVPSQQIKTIADPLIGWKSLPSQSFKGKDEHGNLRRIRTNSLGFFDQDHERHFTNKIQRIAFLGDSFTAGAHIDYEKSFVAITKKELQKKYPQQAFEILNFGQPSFGTINEYLCWKHYASSFKPNHVVLAFFLGNDITNNLPTYQKEIFPSPKFIFQNSELQFVPASSFPISQKKPRKWVYRTFLEPSSLYQQYKLFERDLRAKFKQNRSTKNSSDSETPFWSRDDVPTDWQVYLSDPNPDLEIGWKITEAILLKCAKEIQASGASFHVILIPGLETMLPKEFEKSLTRYPGIESFSFDLNYPRKRIYDFLTKNQILTLDLEAEFRKQISTDQLPSLYFHFDRHFSALGHSTTGEVLAQWLKFNQ